MDRRVVSRVALALTALCIAVPAARAATVTPDVIFGSGNVNGSFTVGSGNGVELGLRAKVRFNGANMPENTFNYDGVRTYTFTDGAPGGIGFGFAPNSSSTASWNFEWAINSNVDGTGGHLNGLTYLLEIDFDPTAGTNFFSFDPINQPFADHAFGDNTTGNGGGIVATNASDYAALIAQTNVAQNSWNMEFFDNAGSGFAFLNSVPGLYDFRLSAFGAQPAFSNGALAEPSPLAQTSITVEVAPVPLPAALPLFVAALGMAGFVGRRRQRPARI